MIKKKLFTIGAVAGCLLTTGCTNDLTADSPSTDGVEKESIVLAAGDNGTAFVTRAGFTGQTRIVAQYVAESRKDGDGTKTVKTVLTASGDATHSTDSYSSISYADGQTRYWDDAFIHNTILSVYAIAVPNVNTENAKLTLAGSNEWSEGTSATTVAWGVTATQTAETLASEDLTYSNNIQQSGDNGVYIWDGTKYPNIPSQATKRTINSVSDGRLYYYKGATDDFTSDASSATGGHYDRGQLNFTHALSRIRVNLKAGDGFTTGETFVLAGNLDILNAMPVSGKLDVKAGTWSDKSTSTAVKMVKTANDATEYTSFGKADLTYEAQVLPGYVFADANAGGIQFTIGDKPYHITNDKLRAALGSNYTMEQGKRYIFNITVSKTKIQNITATVVDWVNVTAETIEKENEHIKFTSFVQSGDACSDIELYKSDIALGKIYTDDSYLNDESEKVAAKSDVAFDGPDTPTKVGGKYQSSWFYENNKTAYQLRTLNSTASAAFDGTNKKTFTMTCVGTDGKAVVNDYHWGAPMSTAELKYNDGFASCIAPAVCSATSDTEIKITELHMMSKLNVKLTTTEDGDKVDLTGAKITLVSFSKSATVDMGTGKVTPATTYSDLQMTAGADNTFSLSVIPQALQRSTAFIGLVIETADGNRYIMDKLTDITASTVSTPSMSNQSESAAITTWYPNHTYTYTFKLKKGKIDILSATVAKWVDVKADDTVLDLTK